MPGTASRLRVTDSKRQLFLCLLASGGAQRVYDVMGDRGDWQPVPSASGLVSLAPARLSGGGHPETLFCG